MASIYLLFLTLPITFAFPSTDFSGFKPATDPKFSFTPKGYDFTQWAPPRLGDVRAPCPCLNSLANHGFLPRDGKNITLPMLLEVLPGAINVQADLATVFFAGATVFGLVKDGQFDLDTLDEHNTIEHDGSLSRADASTGDDHTFNQSIFDKYLSFYDGMANATTGVAGKARMSQILSVKLANPDFRYGPIQQLISNGETALILSVLGDIHLGQAPVEYIRIFFGRSIPFVKPGLEARLILNS